MLTGMSEDMAGSAPTTLHPGAPVRRPFLSDPGEPLLLGRSPIIAGARFGMFVDWSGLGPNDVVSSPLTSIPMPRYRAQYPGGGRLWRSVRPEAMWHPLMWLPRRLAGRMVVEEDEEGSPTVIESPGEWSVRVALEMSMSGLYDSATGQWVDVLALSGLDIDDEATLTRLRDWLRGEPDPVLDGIDLEEHLDVDDGGWSFSLAQEIVPDLTEYSYALSSAALIEAVEDLAEDVGDDSRTEDASHVAGMIAALADVHMPPTREGPSWDSMASQLAAYTGPANGLIDGPLEGLSSGLHEVHDRYAPRLGELDMIAAMSSAATE